MQTVRVTEDPRPHTDPRQSGSPGHWWSSSCCRSVRRRLSSSPSLSSLSDVSQPVWWSKGTAHPQPPLRATEVCGGCGLGWGQVPASHLLLLDSKTWGAVREFRPPQLPVLVLFWFFLITLLASFLLRVCLALRTVL